MRIELGRAGADVRRATTSGRHAGRRMIRAAGSSVFGLPRLARVGARRGTRAIETTVARALVSMIERGTEALRSVGTYVDGIPGIRA